MNKINLSLTAKDLRVLASVLEIVLTETPTEELKSNRQEEYLRCACLMEFYHRLDEKVKSISAFGVVPGKDIKVSIRRTEAIAFFLYFHNANAGELAQSTVTMINGVVGIIHRAFFV